MGDVRRGPLAKAALLTALAALLVAALWLGGVRPWAHALVGAIALASLALLVVDRNRSGGSLRVPLFALPFLVASAATALSLFPLPHALRSALSPDGADRVLRAAALLGPDAAGPLRAVLAFDPPEAALALLRGLAALAVLIVVAHVGARSSARRLAYRVLSGVGAIIFLVAVGSAFLDPAVGWDRLRVAGSIFHAPLVNSNQLGKVFAFFAVLTLGRAVSIRRSPEMAAHGGVGMACAAACVLTDSRAAMFALAVGALVLAVLVLVRRTEDVLPQSPLIIGGCGAAAVSLAVALCTVGSSAVAKLAGLDPEGASKSKVIIWPFAWRLVREHAGLGVGPGAVGAVLPSTLEVGDLRGSEFTYSHVENLVLQVAADHGLPLAALLFAFAAFAAWQVGRSRAAIAAPAATAAVVTLLVGELFDFVTELPVGLLLLAVGLALIAARARAQLPSLELSPRRALASTIALLVVFLLALPVALADWRHAADAALAKLSGKERTEALEHAFARHPSDGHYAYELAVAARNRRDPRGALLAAERAISLWPAHRGAHVEIARALAALGRIEQALLEYRVAWRCGRPDQQLLAEVLGRFSDYAQRRQAFPDDPAALTHLCSALRGSAPDDAQGCLDEVAALPGANAQQRGAHIRFALERGDVEGAVRRADLAMRVSAPDGAVAADAARALAQRDGAAAALSHTKDWAARVRDPRRLLLWRTHTAVAAGDAKVVDESLAALRLCSRTPAELDELDRTEASVHQARGELAEALRLVARLSARAPTDVELGLWQARLEHKLGLPGQASATARRLQRVWPDDARVKALVGELGPGAAAER